MTYNRKATFGQLRDSLNERFFNDKQSWITWQAVTSRKQGELELDTYVTEQTNNFRRLNITDAEKINYIPRSKTAVDSSVDNE